MFKWELEYENADDIDQALRDAGVYVEASDGKWKMADALARKTNDLGKLAGTRDKLRQELKDANAKIADFEAATDGREIDDLSGALDELETLREQKSDFEKGGDKDAAEIRAELHETKAALNKSNRELTKTTNALNLSLDETKKELDKSQGELGSLRFESIFQKEAKDVGIRNSINLVMAGAKQEFKYEDGGIVPIAEDGPDFSSWMSDQVAENAFLTADLKNGGMDTTNNGGGGGKRTIKRGDFDTLSRENPAKAAEVMTSVRQGEAHLVD